MKSMWLKMWKPLLSELTVSLPLVKTVKIKTPSLYIQVGMCFITQAAAIAKLCWTLVQSQEESLKGFVRY